MARHPNGDNPKGEAAKFEVHEQPSDKRAKSKVETIWIRGEGGSVYEMDLPLGEGLAQRLLKGYLTQVNPDGSSYTEKTQAQKLIDTGEAFAPMADVAQVAYGATAIVANQYRPNSVDTLSTAEADYKTMEAKRVLAQDRAFRAEQAEVNKRAANAGKDAEESKKRATDPRKTLEAKLATKGTDADNDNAGWTTRNTDDETGKEASDGKGKAQEAESLQEGGASVQEGGQAQGQAEVGVLTPSRAASKAEWIGYAVRQHGMTPDDAEAMTKADLIEEFGDGL